MTMRDLKAASNALRASTFEGGGHEQQADGSHFQHVTHPETKALCLCKSGSPLANSQRRSPEFSESDGADFVHWVAKW